MQAASLPGRPGSQKKTHEPPPFDPSLVGMGAPGGVQGRYASAPGGSPHKYAALLGNPGSKKIPRTDH
eukprot:2695439-Pyramimonas_sp.AAC.1